MVDERRRKVGDDVARLRKTYWSKLEDKGHVVSDYQFTRKVS
jgi:hypothetical protein